MTGGVTGCVAAQHGPEQIRTSEGNYAPACSGFLRAQYAAARTTAQRLQCDGAGFVGIGGCTTHDGLPDARLPLVWPCGRYASRAQHGVDSAGILVLQAALGLSHREVSR
jgi:hypothetical protein